MNYLKDTSIYLSEILICNSYQEIIPNIYLGNKNSSSNKKLLDKIYLVINCSKDLPFYSNNTYNYRVKVDDDLSLDSNLKILTHITRILPFMKKCYLEKKPILVHCRAGMQRSATLLACFLIENFNFTKEIAILYIRSKRPIAFMIGPHFDFTMELFYKRHQKFSNH